MGPGLAKRVEWLKQVQSAGDWGKQGAREYRKITCTSSAYGLAGEVLSFKALLLQGLASSKWKKKP